jgi:hypothetical protein
MELDSKGFDTCLEKYNRKNALNDLMYYYRLAVNKATVLSKKKFGKER